ncbi:MAG: molecular chaperone TorD family protein [Deferribacterales bacterium]|nr:molecular chaperone TorD family protein [Deferribacterales bacterium]
MNSGRNLPRLINLNYGRAALYDYLYTIFSGSCGKNFIGKSCLFATVFTNMAEGLTDGAQMGKGAGLLSQYAYWESNNLPEVLTENLKVQYTGLFLVGFCGIGATESVYRSAEGINRQEPWAEVRQIYAGRGFKLPDNFKEPEDHIAAELLFMSRMCCLAADLLKEGNVLKASKAIREQITFMEDHLGLWAAQFCLDAEALARSRKFMLYEAAAMLLSSFTEIDKKMLKSVSDRLNSL